jgi:streptogramin lyase
MRRKLILAVCVVSLLVQPALSGEWKVTIREWDVPTANSRPLDPEMAPDGALLYKGQHANKLGRLDPKTGAIKSMAGAGLSCNPGPSSRP